MNKKRMTILLLSAVVVPVLLATGCAEGMPAPYIQEETVLSSATGEGTAAGHAPRNTTALTGSVSSVNALTTTGCVPWKDDGEAGEVTTFAQGGHTGDTDAALSNGGDKGDFTTVTVYGTNAQGAAVAPTGDIHENGAAIMSKTDGYTTTVTRTTAVSRVPKPTTSGNYTKSLRPTATTTTTTTTTATASVPVPPLTYEEYHAMTPERQEAYFERFETIEAFFSWYNAAKAEYEKNKDPIEIDGSGSINIEDIINGQF